MQPSSQAKPLFSSHLPEFSEQELIANERKQTSCTTDLETSLQTFEIKKVGKPEEEFSDERIADRIVTGYKLCLMKNLPETKESYEYTTIITPQGIYQLNQEIDNFKCLLNAEEIQAIHDLSMLLQQAAATYLEEGSIYNTLTLKQLNLLEKIIQAKHGHALIGYPVNEEIYIYVINFLAKWLCHGSSEYPPLPESHSRWMLKLIHQPIVLDVSTSLRVAAQSFLLMGYLGNTYFRYTQEIDDDYVGEQFFVRNALWLLLTLNGFMALSLALLRSGCIDKAWLLAGMNRIRITEQFILACTSNLTNYGQLFVPKSLIKQCFFPVMLLAGIVGYFKSNKPIINISHHTMPKFLFRNFFLALTVGSFFSLGMQPLIRAMFFLYQSAGSSSEGAYSTWSYAQDVSFVRYLAFTIMIVVSFARYPYAHESWQRFGLYASNLMHAISIALLDNFALFVFVNYSFSVFYGLDFSPTEPIAPAIFCTLQALTLLAVFLVTFPNTLNLAEYSIEKNAIQLTSRSEVHNLVASIGKCFLSRKKVSVKIELTTRRFFGSETRLTQFPFHQSSIDTIPSVQNPMH